MFLLKNYNCADLIDSLENKIQSEYCLKIIDGHLDESDLIVRKSGNWRSYIKEFDLSVSRFGRKYGFLYFTINTDAKTCNIDDIQSSEKGFGSIMFSVMIEISKFFMEQTIITGRLTYADKKMVIARGPFHFT